MKIHVKSNTKALNKFIASIKDLDGRAVKAGVPDGEQAWLAGIHEFGVNIAVTPKMRAWLHANGLHLSPNTTSIHIPERSFLRNGFDASRGEVKKQAERALKMLSNGVFDADDVLELIGKVLAGQIKTYARNLRSPAKHPFTLERNGGKANPLVDTGDMINSITFEVE